MAQIPPEIDRRGRAALAMRQRPHLMLVAAVLVLLAVSTAGLGIVLAGREGVSYLPADAQAEEGAPEDVSEGAASEEESVAPEPAEMYVDVGGAVLKPGLIVLDEGARVNDAVQAAGGFTEAADTSAVNLAAPLADGEKLYVPSQGESGAGASSASAQPAGQTGSVSGRININTATLDELDELPGVGPATAQAIIEDREANGRFESLEDIMRVSGIGEKKFEKLEDAISV